jgi:hypothetical protein
VTGAVVQGSQAGAGGHTGAGGGQAAATGVGCRNHVPQQQHPALVRVTDAIASRIDILFMTCVSLPVTSVKYTTATSIRQFTASEESPAGRK